MSTTEDEISVDLDEADQKAKKAAVKEPPEGEIKVETTPEGAPEKPAESAKAAPTVDEGIEKLRRDLENERAARLRAEATARDASASEVQARTQAQKDQLTLITTAISNLKTANGALKSSYAEALRAQDFEKAAEIQEEMSNNSAKLLRLEEGKQAVEKAPAPAARPAVDPVEEFCKQLDPKSAAWVRKHPIYATDPLKYRQMIGAHELAVGRGHDPNSDGYFRDIEKTLGLEETPSTPEPARPNGKANGAQDPHAGADTPESQAATSKGGRDASPAAAPVSRAGSSSNSRSSRTIRLTAAEVEIARASGMTNEEYARNKYALQQEGKIH